MHVPTCWKGLTGFLYAGSTTMSIQIKVREAHEHDGLKMTEGLADAKL